ncbi:hypothetical protein BJX65DRAFT_111303 [Aspergillus insuetus]
MTEWTNRVDPFSRGLEDFQWAVWVGLDFPFFAPNHTLKILHKERFIGKNLGRNSNHKVVESSKNTRQKEKTNGCGWCAQEKWLSINMQDYSTPSSESQKLRPSHQTTTTDSSFPLPFATVLEVCVLFFPLHLLRLPFLASSQKLPLRSGRKFTALHSTFLPVFLEFCTVLKSVARSIGRDPSSP